MPDALGRRESRVRDPRMGSGSAAPLSEGSSHTGEEFQVCQVPRVDFPMGTTSLAWRSCGLCPAGKGIPSKPSSSSVGWEKHRAFLSLSVASILLFTKSWNILSGKGLPGIPKIPELVQTFPTLVRLRLLQTRLRISSGAAGAEVGAGNLSQRLQIHPRAVFPPD